MELDAKLVLEMTFEKINELERELICLKAINQQLIQKIGELESEEENDKTEDNE